MQINNMINILYELGSFVRKKKFSRRNPFSLVGNTKGPRRPFNEFVRHFPSFHFFQRDPEERRIPRRTLRIRREDFPLNGTLIDCCG